MLLATSSKTRPSHTKMRLIGVAVVEKMAVAIFLLPPGVPVLHCLVVLPHTENLQLLCSLLRLQPLAFLQTFSVRHMAATTRRFWSSGAELIVPCWSR